MSDNKLIGVIDSTQTLSGVLKGKSEINVTVTSVGSVVKPYVHPNTHSASIIEETEDRMFMTQQDKEKIQTAIETYVHDQMTSVSEWYIYHGLNKYPAITVVDSAGSVVLGEIQYVSQNEVVLRFISEFSGIAYLN